MSNSCWTGPEPNGKRSSAAAGSALHLSSCLLLTRRGRGNQIKKKLIGRHGNALAAQPTRSTIHLKCFFPFSIAIYNKIKLHLGRPVDSLFIYLKKSFNWQLNGYRYKD